MGMDMGREGSIYGNLGAVWQQQFAKGMKNVVDVVVDVVVVAVAVVDAVVGVVAC